MICTWILHLHLSPIKYSKLNAPSFFILLWNFQLNKKSFSSCNFQCRSLNNGDLFFFQTVAPGQVVKGNSCGCLRSMIKCPIENTKSEDSAQNCNKICILSSQLAARDWSMVNLHIFSIFYLPHCGSLCKSSSLPRKVLMFWTTPMWTNVIWK